jgi:hypothetical protein
MYEVSSCVYFEKLLKLQLQKINMVLEEKKSDSTYCNSISLTKTGVKQKFIFYLVQPFPNKKINVCKFLTGKIDLIIYIYIQNYLKRFIL